ncbi:MAG TPA: hydrogenase nickel incorporation protein HypB [Candidatus Goldiibacteriota bacterium]|nr:hydrogenase nickel incorporation protein HypB [Candidatus Goldiibacteriota bacterium]
MATIDVYENIMKKNDEIAEYNKKMIKKGLCINIMSSPGSGKTTLLEASLKILKKKYKIAVIEGDISTSNDALRIKRCGVFAYQIKTENYGGGCHLDAKMIKEALNKIVKKDNYDFFIVENVGNLICPADFNLGEDKKAVVLSVTEGSDKPLKYPLMFKIADVLVLNKTDLLPYVDFNLKSFEKNVKRINNKLKIIKLSAKTGENINEWIEQLKTWYMEKNIF